MAEYRCVKHQTSRCDMENKKKLTPNYLIISKTYQNKNLFYVLALSVSAKTDKPKVFFIDQIFKKTENQNGQPIMSHRDARGFHQYHLENIFDNANKFTAAAPNPEFVELNTAKTIHFKA